MVELPSSDGGTLRLLAVSVGNTTTRFGVFTGRELARSRRVPNANAAALADQIGALAKEAGGGAEPVSAVVIASVNDPVSRPLVEAMEPRLTCGVYRIGADLPIPIRTALAPNATPGQDRLLNALAAFDSLNQACVVVDTGTAITVDFIDGEGVYQGGAIAPGAAMMLRALHQHTAALPEVSLARPDETVAFGKDTVQAMRTGVFFAVRGLVRALVESYAEAYGAYPPIIATGGDAALLPDGDELIDRIVPDLTLFGIEAACRRSMALEEAEDHG